MLRRKLCKQFLFEIANLLGQHRAQSFIDQFELGRRRQAVERKIGHAFVDLLLQSRDANHEKLVEIGREDREKLDALEQRLRFVERLFEHTAIELEPACFAVEQKLAREKKRRRKRHRMLLPALVFLMLLEWVCHFIAPATCTGVLSQPWAPC